jgi:hypothetical protein
MLDTAKVQDRRKLQYASIDALLADVDKLVAAEKAGKLRRSGNWTVGQAFNHLGTWINYGYEGFPMRVPWFIRMLIKTKLKKYLTAGMDAGVRIPKSPDGTYATDVMGVDEGAKKLRDALARLKKGEPAKFDSPAFGKMSQENRVKLNLRHAELHLSFFHP